MIQLKKAAIGVISAFVLGGSALAGFAFESPLVIGHRGACGYVPEHTLKSYETAIEMGADYVEPDLVSTKDGVLICRHECEIGDTTDVSERYPDRKRKTVIDGKEIEGWFAEDFTLQEIKTLRVKERTDFRDHSKDGLYNVPTFQEMISLVKEKERELGKTIGIYPETKHPSYHDSIGLSLEEPLLSILTQNGMNHKGAPVFIQSFEISNLKELHKKTPIRLVQLFDEFDVVPGDVLLAGGKTTYRDMSKLEGLKEIASYAYGIGPWKELILPRGSDNRLLQDTGLLKNAHKAGLKVHIYTMRNEGRYLAEEYKGNPIEEYRRWIAMGVDGFFTDFPDTAVRARLDASR